MFRNLLVISFCACAVASTVNAQSFDDKLASIDRLQTIERISKQKAEAAQQRAKAARQAKMDSREEENYKLEMEIKRMEMQAKKKQLEQQARMNDIQLSRQEAQAEREAALEKARTKNADSYIQNELAAGRAATDVLQSRADANRTVSEGVKKNLSKRGIFERNE